VDAVKARAEAAKAAKAAAKVAKEEAKAAAKAAKAEKKVTKEEEKAAKEEEKSAKEEEKAAERAAKEAAKAVTAAAEEVAADPAPAPAPPAGEGKARAGEVTARTPAKASTRECRSCGLRRRLAADRPSARHPCSLCSFASRPPLNNYKSHSIGHVRSASHSSSQGQQRIAIAVPCGSRCPVAGGRRSPRRRAGGDFVPADRMARLCPGCR
jgi:hypothetical protein